VSLGDISMAFDTTTFEIGKNRIDALSDGIFMLAGKLRGRKRE